jgi:hypothetical protein
LDRILPVPLCLCNPFDQSTPSNKLYPFSRIPGYPATRPQRLSVARVFLQIYKPRAQRASFTTHATQRLLDCSRACVGSSVHPTSVKRASFTTHATQRLLDCSRACVGSSVHPPSVISVQSSLLCSRKLLSSRRKIRRLERFASQSEYSRSLVPRSSLLLESDVRIDSSVLIYRCSQLRS